MIGLAIDPTTNDLMLDGGALRTVTDAEAVGQHVRQRLLTHAGEWFLDTDAGVPWIDEIFAQAYSAELAEAVVKAEILDTAGVTEITAFGVSFVQPQRELRIKDVRVMTTYDEVTV